MTEIKRSNAIFVANGNGYKLPRISIPKKWATEMGITEESKEVKITYEDGKIIIEKY